MNQHEPFLRLLWPEQIATLVPLDLLRSRPLHPVEAVNERMTAPIVQVLSADSYQEPGSAKVYAGLFMTAAVIQAIINFWPVAEERLTAIDYYESKWDWAAYVRERRPKEVAMLEEKERGLVARLNKGQDDENIRRKLEYIRHLLRQEPQLPPTPVHWSGASDEADGDDGPETVLSELTPVLAAFDDMPPLL